MNCTFKLHVWVKIFQARKLTYFYYHANQKGGGREYKIMILGKFQSSWEHCLMHILLVFFWLLWSKLAVVHLFAVTWLADALAQCTAWNWAWINGTHNGELCGNRSGKLFWISLVHFTSCLIIILLHWGCWLRHSRYITTDKAFNEYIIEVPNSIS